MFGTFSEESLLTYSQLVKEKTKRVKKVAGTEMFDNWGVGEHDHSFIDNDESQDKNDYAETWDYTVCLRSDGSRYGTAGKCRKGTQTEKAGKEEREGRLRETYGKAYLALDNLKQRRKKLKDGKKAAELDARVAKLQKVLKSVGAAQSKVRVENAKGEQRENFGKLPQWATEGRGNG
jgi:hypothetical protein